jgi:hypothetical protein
LKTDKWPQLKTKAPLLKKWEEIKDCGMPPPVSGSKNPASMALQSLAAGIIDADEEHEYDEIKQHVVWMHEIIFEMIKCTTMIVLYLPWIRLKW